MRLDYVLAVVVSLTRRYAAPAVMTSRDKSIICVVDSVQGQLAIESTGEFKGQYHVLHGVLSPLDV